jgi:putative ABC transport system permease protein
VIGLVLLVSTGACVLALGLLVDSRAPFDHAFAASHGAHVAAAIDGSRATSAELAATTRLPEVTAASGPFPETTITPEQGGQMLGPITLVGRASPSGPLDDVTLQAGHWPERPGQVVFSNSVQFGYGPGTRITFPGLPGTPTLTVVGTATSVTNSANGWVVPGEIAKLRAPGTPAMAEMLYRFRSAGTAAAVRADVSALIRALPPGAVTGTQSYLAVEAQESSGIAPFVPFLETFAIIGMVLSVLIVGNVVSGAVVAGTRRIGILKSIGFTPSQVVAVYISQALGPATAGCLGGVVLGNLLSRPLLGRTASVYGVGRLGVPGWVDVVVPLALCCMVGVAALVPAIQAGRLSAVQALAAGRTPRQRTGRAAQRLLSRLPLPRPVTMGLAAPFTRPARATATMAAILLGATAVTFAVGLSTSLNQVVAGITHATAEPVQVSYLGTGRIDPRSQTRPMPVVGAGMDAAAQATVAAAVRAEPGTLHYVARADGQVSVAGLAQQIPVTAFRGDAGWTGYDMISGHWYTGPDQVDVPAGFLSATGEGIGETITIAFDGRQIPVRIAGEVFDTQNKGLAMITGWQTLATADPGLEPDRFDIGLRPDTSATAYGQALGTVLGSKYEVEVKSGESEALVVIVGLIGILALLLAIVAGLGVLNTVVLQTREQVHDIGVFKAVGMTPRQAVAMVVCSVAGTGLVAGVIAVPAGVTLNRYVLPAVLDAASAGVPASFLNVYRGWEFAFLALAGVVIAVTGALFPAGWAAQIRTAEALHAE